ncbi:MAG: hypothetical protein ACLBM1_08615, partial [Cuspidothrix sp.]
MGGNRQVTIDVYTLAASLYYAVTGKRPESSLDRKLYNKPLISPNKYVVRISDGLNRAILKGMNLEAENRPQSMREWLKLLPDVGNQVYQVSQKIEHQTIRTEKTVPVIVGVNNSPNVRVNRTNIPWFLLGAINLIYLITGVLLPANLVTLFLALFLASIPTRFYKWAIDNFMEITLERIFYYQAVIIVAVISNVYFYPKEKLEKYFSKLHTSLIMICTSYLGLFLGWLI